MIANLLKAHWQVAGVVALILVAFLVGRCARPDPPAQVTTVDHTTEKQLADAREQINTLTQQVATLKTKTHEVKTVVVHKDGTKTVQDVRDTDTDQTTQTQDQAQTVATQQVQTTREQTTTTIVTAYKPQWRVSLLAGVDVLHLSQPQLIGPVMLGAMVERRIAGPVWLGAWGTSSGVGGVALSVEF